MVLAIAMTNQGVKVQLRDDVGRVLQELIDPPTAWKCVASVPEESLPLLASVDIYGDTEFRSYECRALVEEIRRIRGGATGDDAHFLEQVEQAATRASVERNLRVVFLGA
jgi:hypothetical protein